ncbi:MAG: immune inhibitor A [Saprospiraceae bacterium]|nr:immune inhibitor A [Saprospiraceae bacterium]
MRRLLLGLVLTSCAAVLASAQGYVRAKIHAGQESWGHLSSLGLALDHTTKTLDDVQGSFSHFELSTAIQHGYQVDTLSVSAERYYRDLKSNAARSRTDCPDLSQIFEYERPANFRFGTMKGHPTYDQMMEQLVSMHALYPHLISAPTPIGSFKTFEGRSIYSLSMSDNPMADEGEPEILYTALHHAREPISMTQMLYFMWYMLENYDKDARIREIINETKLVFVPCLNPDGYLYNERTNPTGGGLWRKNRRVLENGHVGVDLNRNYGHKWGLDNLGSSPNPQSETYRGAAPFSEPETQAIRALAEGHDFRLALNYHAWGNFLIYPLGYTNEPAEDLEIFQNIGDLLTRENRFVHGTGFETVAYFTNGDSDDWMYLDNDVKRSILSFTPEIGGENHGFWPPTGEVELLCKGVLNQNINAAFFLLNSGALVDESPMFLTDREGTFPFRLTKFGFEEVGLQITIDGISDNIQFDQRSKFYILDLFAVEQDQFEYQLDSDIQDGEEIWLSYTIDNGTYAYSDTIRKFYREPDFLISNDGTMQSWKSTGFSANWGVVDHTYYSPPTSLTDSPLGNYFPLSSNDLVYDDVLDLTGADSAVLYFQARWDIQPIMDYMTVEVSASGDDFVPQCGIYTRPGGPRQLEGAPVYSGRQLSWVPERIDLSEYIGRQVRLRFSMNAMSNDSRDGIYIDDIRLLLYNEGIISSSQFIDPAEFSISAFPNPASDLLRIQTQMENRAQVPSLVAIYDAMGRLHARHAWQDEIELPTAAWPSGYYFLQVIWADGRVSRAQGLSIKH